MVNLRRHCRCAEVRGCNCEWAKPKRVVLVGRITKRDGKIVDVKVKGDWKVVSISWGMQKTL